MPWLGIGCNNFFRILLFFFTFVTHIIECLIIIPTVREKTIKSLLFTCKRSFNVFTRVEREPEAISRQSLLSLFRVKPFMKLSVGAVFNPDCWHSKGFNQTSVKLPLKRKECHTTIPPTPKIKQAKDENRQHLWMMINRLVDVLLKHRFYKGANSPRPRRVHLFSFSISTEQRKSRRHLRGGLSSSNPEGRICHWE